MDESSLNGADVSSISLRQLEGFLEVARTLNFRRAAESLYLSYPR
jgi:DNA-binding transcriptional LysR family regulator